MKKLFALCLMLAMLMTAAFAEESAPVIADAGLNLMGCSVRYPQVTGLDDEARMKQINSAILEAGNIQHYLGRVALLMSSPVKLNVSYTYTLAGDVFSCAMLADGAVETTRSTQVWHAVNIDLNTGDPIPFDALFTDADATRAYIENVLAQQLAPELSAHLAADALTPMPETWSITPYGLTLHYGIDRYRTLNDGAGTVTFLWSELREFIDLREGSILFRIGAQQHLTLDESSRERIAQAISVGTLMEIPAALGDGIADLIALHGEAIDPDLYEGGRLISLDGGAFRQVWLLTDRLTESVENSVVQGIRTDRINLHGLMSGVTTLEDWRKALGAPETTLSVDAERADSWRILPGSSDYYTFGDYRLRLHADESGVLRSVFLSTR